jgi:hypothetical protein
MMHLYAWSVEGPASDEAGEPHKEFHRSTRLEQIPTSWNHQIGEDARKNNELVRLP